MNVDDVIQEAMRTAIRAENAHLEQAVIAARENGWGVLAIYRDGRLIAAQPSPLVPVDTIHDVPEAGLDAYLGRQAPRG